MKTSQLKTLIKNLVRECVHEILAEKYIEQSVNEMAGKKRSIKETMSLVDDEPYHPATSHNPPPRQIKESRADLAEKYGFDANSDFAAVYEDTARNNTYADAQRPGVDPPGTISEAAMEKSGIIGKDWSKYF